MEYKEIEGNLITLALQGKFDVIAHGCNCFCTMGAGLAPQMAKAFGCDVFSYEDKKYRGDINKLGNIDFEMFILDNGIPIAVNDSIPYNLAVVNCYTQYKYGTNHIDGEDKPLDYAALELCFKKMNHIFKGKHIGLPGFIGCGLAGGDVDKVKEIIKKELVDCKVTIVIFNIEQ